MNVLEDYVPRDPEQIIFGELQQYKGWGSWNTVNCTLLKTVPRGGEAEYTLCYADAVSNVVGVGGEGGRKGAVLNVFHHQLEEVSVIKRKKFEFSIRTQYDAEHDPMARPEESLKLRAKTQDDFEKWVDALTTWSQALQAMSLLRF